MRRRYLVTGGAGYVGSHVVAALADRGDEIVVIDNLRQGHRRAVLDGARLIEADLSDSARLDAVLAEGRWDGVLHFASLSLVGESMRQPFRYLMENAMAGIGLIDACVRHGIARFVLSSTANLFGSASGGPIAEDVAIDPGSPYGESKWMIERALLWADRLHGLRSARLRYFNAAGADPAGRLGEDHRPETHLIPLVIDAALGRRPPLEVFGDDYPTPDGTCIRDYIHVTDLARAHWAALRNLRAGGASDTFNCGYGRGSSVLEVIEAIRRVSGLAVDVDYVGRRAGDAASLVADTTRIRATLDWEPQYENLDTIVSHALAWEIRLAADPEDPRGEATAAA